jgi:hypothetical protein
VIRVARVPEDLLVLDPPLVELPPVERGVTGEECGRRDRLRVGPDRIRLEAVSDPDRAVRRLSLVRATSLLVARLEQVVPEVFLWHVIHSQVRGLVQELRAERVEDGLACEEAAQPVRHRVEVEDGARRRVGREVELPRGPVAERPRA